MFVLQMVFKKSNFHLHSSVIVFLKFEFQNF